jgi:hypothetical protein
MPSTGKQDQAGERRLLPQTALSLAEQDQIPCLLEILASRVLRCCNQYRGNVGEIVIEALLTL